jgi:DNA-binding MarR family transcriptional regulator
VIELFCSEFAEQSGDATMGMQQFRLLLSLATQRKLNQSDLSRYTGVQKSSNGRNIDRLGSGSMREKGLGLLKSEEDPMDRRYKLVELTPKGRQLLESCATATLKKARL